MRFFSMLIRAGRVSGAYSRFKTVIPYIAKSMSTASEVAVLQLSREAISQRGELKKIFL